MDKQPDKSIIAKLLEDLRNKERYRDINAIQQAIASIQKIVKYKIRDEQIINVLTQMASSDPDKIIRDSARDALDKLNDESILPELEIHSQKQFHEGTVQNILKDLRYTARFRNTGSIKRILKSIEAVVSHEIGEQRIVTALNKLASSDSNTQVREAAADALTALKQLGFDTSVSNTDGALEEAWYEQLEAFEPLKKLWDFLAEHGRPIAGFAGWFIINGLYFYDNLGVHGMRLSDGDAFGLVIFTVPANLLVLIVSALIKPTRGLAFGILLAMAANLVIATILGVGHNALYFVPFFQD